MTPLNLQEHHQDYRAPIKTYCFNLYQRLKTCLLPLCCDSGYFFVLVISTRNVSKDQLKLLSLLMAQNHYIPLQSITVTLFSYFIIRSIPAHMLMT